MAYIRKRGKRWSVEIELLGQTANSTFATKAEALAWAVDTERQIHSGKNPGKSGKTIRDIFDRFAEEEAPRRTKAKAEQNRLAYYAAYEFEWTDKKRAKLGDLTIDQADSSVFVRLRDTRLGEVSGATLIRDFNFLSTVFRTAVSKWKWTNINPVSAVKRPKDNPARQRIASDDEIEQIEAAALWSEGEVPETIAARAVAAFVVCTQCGMRGGELLAVKPEWIDAEKRVITLPHFQNLTGHASKTRRREVAISERGMTIVKNVMSLGLDPVFQLTPTQKDANFRKMTKRAGVTGLTFHDSRATFCTWASRKMPVQALARQLGHANLAELLTYYRESGEEIARML